MRNLFLFISALFLISCDESPTLTEVTQTASAPAVGSAQAETERFNQWLDELWEEQLDFSPEFRTSLGIKEDYNQLDDYTLQAQEEQLAWLRNSVTTMEGDFDYDSLDIDLFYFEFK